MSQPTFKRGDLHCHSRSSDGSFTIGELIELAQEIRLDYLGITDHDTLDGARITQLMADSSPIMLIPGIEVSAWDPKTHNKIHLLGYWSLENVPRSGDNMPSSLETLCTPILKARDLQTRKQIKIISSLGFPVSQTEVEAEASPSRFLYKQHLMSVLVKKGVCDSIYGNFYQKMFKNNGPAQGDINYVSVFDALDAMKDDNAFPVLAHPGQQNSLEIVPELVNQGLLGIELIHPDNSPTHQKEILSIARQFDLILTGGSDFHGKYGNNSDPQLGTLDMSLINFNQFLTLIT
jgi:predicted metal-dependent phosphoesterase TrpH